jgi:hypothetical protein
MNRPSLVELVRPYQEEFNRTMMEIQKKLELQKQYIEVKNKYDELSELYWSLEEHQYFNLLSSTARIEVKEDLAKEIKEQFILLKSLNKQLYYGESTR